MITVFIVIHHTWSKPVYQPYTYWSPNYRNKWWEPANKMTYCLATITIWSTLYPRKYARGFQFIVKDVEGMEQELL